MSFFSSRFSRGKNSRSPSPASQQHRGNGSSNRLAASTGGDHSENGQLPLRSRGGAGNGGSRLTNNSVLPQHHGSSSSTASNNNFLLGGMYVPDKDKKFRLQRRARGGNRVYRFRITAEIVDLWQRLWRTSPAVGVVVSFLGTYVLVVFVLFPLATSIHYHSRDAAAAATAPTSHHRQRRQQGIDWLATDSSLLDLLPSAREERRRVEKLHTERQRIRKQLEGNDHLAILESLAPKWFHRNDVKVATLAENVVAAPKVTDQSSNVAFFPKRISDAVGDRLNASPSSVQKGKSDSNLPANPRLIRNLHTMEKIPNYSHCGVNLSDTDLAVTLVVQSSLDRVWILDETCARWKAPIVVVVAVKPEERLNATQSLVGWRDKCPQLNLIVYHLDSTTEGTPELYPVNRLRNVALDAVKTSHVLVVDVDFVPSTNLPETIQRILRSQPLNDKEAIVVPAFQRNIVPPCATEVECKQHLRNDSKFIPSNFDDLRGCFDAKDCVVFQGDVNWEGHSSTRSHEWLERKWYNSAPAHATDGQTIKSIACFESLRYEPYVVIRWCPNASQAAAQGRLEELDYENASNAQNNRSTDAELTARPLAPYYDERFHGYGKNKIQHISHLRLLGYKFSVLPEGFIVHNPHVESPVKKTWNDAAQSKLHSEMDVLYRNYLRELVDKYYETHGAHVIDQCSGKHH